MKTADGFYLWHFSNQSHIVGKVAKILFNPFQEELIIIKIGFQSQKVRHFSKVCISLCNFFLLCLKSDVLDSTVHAVIVVFVN